MSKKVPLVVYTKEGERQIIGEAVVNVAGSHVLVSAKVYDVQYAEFFSQDVKQISMGNARPDSKEQ